MDRLQKLGYEIVRIKNYHRIRPPYCITVLLRFLDSPFTVKYVFSLCNSLRNQLYVKVKIAFYLNERCLKRANLSLRYTNVFTGMNCE